MFARNLQIKTLFKDDIDRILPLINKYNFNDYRNYRLLKKKSISQYLLKQINILLDNTDNHVLIAEFQNEVVGLISLKFLPWTTDIFNIKIADINHILAKGTEDEQIVVKRQLVDNLLLLCQNKGIAFLSSRIDVSDLSSFDVLGEKGFQIKDTLVTYLFYQNKLNFKPMKQMYQIRRFKKADLSQLLSLVDKTSWDTHFSRDPRFRKAQINCLYKKWIQTFCANLSMTKAFVAEKKGEIGGFVIVKQNEIFEDFFGLKMFGRGLSVVDPHFKGAYPLLIKTALEYHVEKQYDLCEFDTKLDKYEVLKIWQTFGLNFVRAKHTLHKWIEN